MNTQVRPASRAVPAPRRRSGRSKNTPWLLLASLILITAMGLLAHAGTILNILFPSMALAVGFYLYWTDPGLYIGYVMWLWFLSPFVRRIVDYRSHYHPQSPVQLAPLLVSSLTLFTLVRNLGKFNRVGLFPFVLIATGILYGYVVGLFTNGPMAASYDFLQWLTPAALGAHLALNANHYPAISKAFLKATITGLMVIGAYGVYQFFYMPAWDSAWVKNAQMNSLGVAEALELRVFGTMNSAGPYANALAACLCYLFAEQGAIRYASAAFGLPALALSLVRSAWGQLVLAVVVFLYRRKGSGKIRTVLAAVAAIAVALPLLTVGPLAKKFSERIASVSDLQHDNSMQARISFYKNFLETAVSSPLGEGMGALGTAAKLNAGQSVAFDSGLMAIPYVLGWPGSFLYFAGIAWLSFLYLLKRPLVQDPVSIAAGAVALSILAQIVFFNTLIGVIGLWFWTGIGLIAAQRGWRPPPSIARGPAR
jgi:hypothetical protein